MLRSSTVRILLVVVLGMAALTLLRFKPWEKKEVVQGRETLRVGFLPVT